MGNFVQLRHELRENADVCLSCGQLLNAANARPITRGDFSYGFGGFRFVRVYPLIFVGSIVGLIMV